MSDLETPGTKTKPAAASAATESLDALEPSGALDAPGTPAAGVSAGRDRLLADVLQNDGRFDDPLGRFGPGGADKGFDLGGLSKGFDKGFDKSKGKFDFSGSLEDLYGSSDSGSKTGAIPREMVPSDRDYDVLRTFLKDVPAKPGQSGMKPSEIAEELRTIFPRLNQDGNDRLDSRELSQAVQNPEYTGKSAQALAAVYAATRNDPFETVTMDGISKMAKLDRIVEVRPALERVSALARAIGTGENVLTKEMLAERVNETQNPTERQTLQDALNSFDLLRQLSGSAGDGITSDGMRKLIGLPNRYQGDGLVRQFSQISDRVAESQKHDGKTLFGDYGGFLGFFQNTGIVPEAVQQGVIQDCNLFAPLMSLAKVAPDEIRNMIKDNGDGTYTVTFPGAKDQPMTVSAPTQAEQGLYSSLTKFGTWPAVIEKAYGEFVRRNPGFADLRNAPCGPDAPSAECLSQGGYAEGVMILTGSDSDILDLRKGGDSRQTIAEQLAEGVRDGKVMTIASAPKRFRETGDNVESLHNYSIVDFDRKGPGGGTLTLLDPYGRKSIAKDATLKVSVDQLSKDFEWIAIEHRLSGR